VIETEAVVVGAGPSGAVTALLLARHGHDVVLVDRARFPRDKACGEGVMPLGVEALRRMGLYATVLATGARPLGGVTWVWCAGLLGSKDDGGELLVDPAGMLEQPGRPVTADERRCALRAHDGGSPRVLRLLHPSALAGPSQDVRRGKRIARRERAGSRILSRTLALSAITC